MISWLKNAPCIKCQSIQGAPNSKLQEKVDFFEENLKFDQFIIAKIF
jgi:hypothetical protein